MSPLTGYLVLSCILFAIGLAGALSRRQSVLVLAGIELMLNAANLNFVAFWRFSGLGASSDGLVFVLFSLAIAASEAAVGFALVIAVYRHFRSSEIDGASNLKSSRP